MNLISVARRANLGHSTKKGYDQALSKLKVAKEYNVNVSTLLEDSGEHLEFHKANYLIGILSILEAYISDTLFEYLVCYPGHTNEKNISFDTVAKAGSIGELSKASALKKLNELNYKKFSDFHDVFSTTLSLTSKFNEDILNLISEIKATRDIYVHANGICNEIYISKSGRLSRSEVGKKLPITAEYIKHSEEKIEEYIKLVYSGVPEKIKGYGRVKAFKEMWFAGGLSSLRPFDDFWESNVDQDMVRPKQELFDFAWSGSEKAAVDFFLGIYSRDHPERKTDLMYALMKWPPSTNMGRVIISWAEYPFWF